MIELLFKMALSNALFALGLAAIALIVGARTKRPQLAHLLWLLVFVKLITPPLFAVSNFMSDGSAVAMTVESTSGSASVSVIEESVEAGVAFPWLPAVWLLGAALVFGWSLVRVWRFNRLLTRQSAFAPDEVQHAATGIAQRLGMNAVPLIHTTSARLSPMVWWAGGAVRVVIPSVLIERMDEREWRWVLAHELAHVRRRDHLVRWLEWLACVVFWWNPVVWWAQRNLRAMEEMCCDDLVIASLKPKPRSYANAILTAVEHLVPPAFRLPAMASEINSGGTLERRMKMIVSKHSNRSLTRGLQACVLLCAMVVLPLGLASATDYDAVAKRLREAVSAGELNGEQAEVMINALRRTEGGERATRTREQDADAKGEYARAERELKQAVENGRISAEDARKRLGEIRRAIGERAEQGAREERSREPRRISREDFARAEREIMAGVKAGRISEKDAKVRLGEMRRMMTGQGEREREGDREAEFIALVNRIEMAVENGDMSREEGRKKIAEMKERMMAGERAGEEERMAKFRHMAEGIEREVETGEITREQAAEKIAYLKREFFGDKERSEKKDKEREMDERKAKFAEIEADIDRAVKAGRITKEEAEEKLDHVRREYNANRKPVEKTTYYELRGRTMAEKEADVKRAVEAGKITLEQGKVILDSLTGNTGYRTTPRKNSYTRTEAGKQPEAYSKKREAVMKQHSGDRDRGIDERKAKYAEIEADIDRAVKAGKMSEKDAREKLDAIKKDLFGGKETAKKTRPARSTDERRAKFNEIKADINRAVESGRMTEEQAREKLHAVEKELFSDR